MGMWPASVWAPRSWRGFKAFFSSSSNDTSMRWYPGVFTLAMLLAIAFCRMVDASSESRTAGAAVCLEMAFEKITSHG